MTQFTFTTDYHLNVPAIVTIAVDGEDLSIVSATQNGVIIDTNLPQEGDDLPISRLLLEAAGDYAFDHKLYETEDRYVPERKHWEVSEDNANRFHD